MISALGMPRSASSSNSAGAGVGCANEAALVAAGAGPAAAAGLADGRAGGGNGASKSKGTVDRETVEAALAGRTTWNAAQSQGLHGPNLIEAAWPLIQQGACAQARLSNEYDLAKAVPFPN